MDMEGTPTKSYQDDDGGTRRDEPGKGFRSSPVVDLAELLAKRQHHSLVDWYESETDQNDDSDCSTVAISNLSIVETDAVIRTNVSEESLETEKMEHNTITKAVVATNASVTHSSWIWDSFCGLHAPIIYCMADE